MSSTPHGKGLVDYLLFEYNLKSWSITCESTLMRNRKGDLATCI